MASLVAWSRKSCQELIPDPFSFFQKTKNSPLGKSLRNRDGRGLDRINRINKINGINSQAII
jgi:hypothetical protein